MWFVRRHTVYPNMLMGTSDLIYRHTNGCWLAKSGASVAWVNIGPKYTVELAQMGYAPLRDTEIPFDYIPRYTRPQDIDELHGFYRRKMAAFLKERGYE